jgi:hypothetical protein
VPAVEESGAGAGFVAEPVSAVAVASEVGLPQLVDLWPAVCQALAESNNQLAVMLRDARPIAVVGREVTVGFDRDHAFQYRIADQGGNRESLAESIRTITGLDARLTIELHDLADLVPEVAAAQAPPSPDEWVDRLKQEFDAEEIVPDQES